jgi:hypothetical protein
MNRTAIIDAMETKVLELFKTKEPYCLNPKRGMMVVQIRDNYNHDQWESTLRAFGTCRKAPELQGDMPINSGVNNDAVAHDKIAYVRRTGKNSGAPYYDVIGTESVYKGALLSEDKNCICSFSGFTPDDDVLVVLEGIREYERQKEECASTV